jgi:hypothetical protein
MPKLSAKTLLVALFFVPVLGTVPFKILLKPLLKVNPN